MSEANPLSFDRDTAWASPDVLAERERCFALIGVLAHGLHEQALHQALRAIRSGASRAEMVSLGLPWSLDPNGRKYQP